MSVKEYFFKEGCFIEEWLNTADQAEMSVARVRVEKGETTKLHSLKNTTERYVILSGQARVTVGDNSWNVREKDVVTINSGTPQKITNLGQADLIFLAICTPRFEVDNYQEINE